VNAATLRRPAVVFGMTACVLAAACVALIRSRAFAGHPDVLAAAVTLDFTITIPVLYYLLVVRRGAARAITIAPVFVVSAAIAALVIPRAYHQTLYDLRFLLAPLEVVAIIVLLRRIAAIWPRGDAASDPLTRFEVAAREVFGESLAARFVASEVSITWYAIFGWRRTPHVPTGARGFTIHERSGWGSAVVGFIVLIFAESIAVHLFIQQWSATAAWIVAFLDLYGILWLLGDYNALRLRPSLVQGDVLTIRYGLRWSVTVSRSQIAKIRAAEGEADWKRRGVLKVALLDDPRFIIELTEPVVANGLAGFRKTIRAIAIAPDDDAILCEWQTA
jgi:hypothetical protein